MQNCKHFNLRDERCITNIDNPGLAQFHLITYSLTLILNHWKLVMKQERIIWKSQAGVKSFCWDWKSSIFWLKMFSLLSLWATLVPKMCGPGVVGPLCLIHHWSLFKPFCCNNIFPKLSIISKVVSSNWQEIHHKFQWTKILYQDYLHHIAEFHGTVINIFSKEIISNNVTKF